MKFSCRRRYCETLKGFRASREGNGRAKLNHSYATAAVFSRRLTPRSNTSSILPRRSLRAEPSRRAGSVRISISSARKFRASRSRRRYRGSRHPTRLTLGHVTPRLVIAFAPGDLARLELADRKAHLSAYGSKTVSPGTIPPAISRRLRLQRQNSRMFWCVAVLRTSAMRTLKGFAPPFGTPTATPSPSLPP